jgi:hypothetical protein
LVEIEKAAVVAVFFGGGMTISSWKRRTLLALLGFGQLRRFDLGTRAYLTA